jgi:hypothetical protein
VTAKDEQVDPGAIAELARGRHGLLGDVAHRSEQVRVSRRRRLSSTSLVTSPEALIGLAMLSVGGCARNCPDAQNRTHGSGSTLRNLRLGSISR